MKYFATLPLFFLQILVLNAQNWTVGAKWIYEQEEYMPTPEEEYRTFTKEKDTLIQNRLCSQILEKFVIIYNNTISESSQGRHFLFQENQKVLVFEPDSMKFFPLYDFSKKSGDTLITYCAWTNKTLNLVVDSVTISNLGNQALKVQWVHTAGFGSCSMYGRIFERIGYGAYLFARPGFVDPPPGGGLICFSDSLLTFPEGSNCSLTVSSKEPLVADLLKVFPNPTTDWIFFENAEVEKIRVFSLFGQLLKIQNGGKELSLKAFPDGVYLLEIQTSKGTFLKKAFKKS